ncbi:MAG TPA: ATP-binding protein [Anaerolineae bacterium]|nr:ATP-binding protein [Anaerolineae bacterium]
MKGLPMFVNREQELDFLNSLLKRTRPASAHLILLYGRRRVGKTVLARHWAESTGLPTVYWPAEREPAGLQRRKMYARVLGVPMAQAPTFESWADLWTAFVHGLGGERQILIIDEVTYAAESDPAFLSALQHAWDEHLKQSRLILVLSGSHVHTMETLLARGSPLFGRFTGQWHLQPLEFSALRQFFPRWSTDERVAAYAIVGGVPAYVEWLQPDRSLTDNIREVILAPGGLFIAEPELLLYNEVRDPRVYQAILQAIGAGSHTLDAISNTTIISKTHLSSYLSRLRELRLVERRLPATIPPDKIRVSRMGRYHIADPFLRFYYRFIAPQRAEVGYRREDVLASIQDQLRSFVGVTAFEELCREWVSRAHRIPFDPQQVGSHWSRHVQVDVVAVSWRDKAVLLGECKWITDRVPREVLTKFLDDTTPKLLRDLPKQGAGWSVHHAMFSRAGFTPAAFGWAKERSWILVDLSALDRDLS